MQTHLFSSIRKLVLQSPKRRISRKKIEQTNRFQELNVLARNIMPMFVQQGKRSEKHVFTAKYLFQWYFSQSQLWIGFIINSRRYQQCLSSSNQYRSILESFPNPSPMSGWKHWRPTPVSAPRKVLQRKTLLRQRYFLLAGSSISYILPKYLCAGSCILHIYEIFQIFKYLCAGPRHGQNNKKGARESCRRGEEGDDQKTGGESIHSC